MPHCVASSWFSLSLCINNVFLGREPHQGAKIVWHFREWLHPHHQCVVDGRFGSTKPSATSWWWGRSQSLRNSGRLSLLDMDVWPRTFYQMTSKYLSWWFQSPDNSKISEALPKEVPVACQILHNYFKKSKKCHLYIFIDTGGQNYSVIGQFLDGLIW
jgi:hypothetical protein